VNIKDKDIIRKYVRESIVEKVFYVDIPRLFKIGDASVLEPLLNILMEDPGELVELSGLAKELKLSRQTLSRYLTYLEESFLLRKLYNYSKSRRKVERKLKKYYPALVSVDLLFKEDDLSKSRVFEWFIVNALKPEFFWRDPYKKEVDVVLVDGGVAPIEVKYGRIDLSGLLAFMKKFKVSQGYVVSTGEEREQRIDDKAISIVPAFKFLLK
jgi:predicted AAA+ superfamily ATPase